MVSFFNRHKVDISDMSSRYEEGTGRRCQQHDHVTYEHHYHFGIFNFVIDFQLMKLDHRFNDGVGRGTSYS